jgi:hypothetical protein
MNTFIIIQIILFTLLIVGSLSGFIGWGRVGQIFLAIGLYDLILSIAAWRGWPILRGDVSYNTPLNKRDTGEAILNRYSLGERPSIGFVMKLAGAGILTCSVGVILLVLCS